MDQFSHEMLAARAEIQHVMNRWCRAVDRADWATIRDVFHPDGQDDHGIYRGGVDGLIAWLSERHKTIERSMHLCGNMLIEFSDPDNALVETYSFSLQRYAAGGAATRKAIAGGADIGDTPFDMLISGRYVDHFQKRDGAWRVFRRTVVFDNSMIIPAPENAPALNPDWAISTRDGSDPIWALRTQVALQGVFTG